MKVHITTTLHPWYLLQHYVPLFLLSTLSQHLTSTCAPCGPEVQASKVMQAGGWRLRHRETAGDAGERERERESRGMG